MTHRDDLYLAPSPKRLVRREGTFEVHGKKFIKLEAPEPQVLLAAAKKTGLGLQITASPRASGDEVALTIRLDANAGLLPDGYKLSVRRTGMEIVASDSAGAFYGACTLAQILRQCGAGIPCLSITDWPDFSMRGVMLDISRDKVPTMETLYHLVDLLSEWKINQLQLYMEHAFAYLAHPVVWEHASPMTGEEIMALDAYCKSRFIELVPNQNSFGHMERWLKHPEYNSLAESPKGCMTAWGFRPAFSLCPVDARSIRLVRGLYDELLPHFSSRLFNVGCDETVDLGCGRSKRACKARGKGRVYLDFLLQVHRLVKDRGRTMMFWGDIIVQHPELIPEVPRDVIALEWGYESDHPFARHGKMFHESGVPFCVCPGTSSWNWPASRLENAIGNISNAAKNGLAQEAIGLLNTDWGDSGHWQPLSVSYLGFMAGAMASWDAKSDLRRDLAHDLSIHAFGDLSGEIGRAFYDLGNVYLVFKKTFSWPIPIPWQILFGRHNNVQVQGIDIGEVREMERRLDEIAGGFSGVKMNAPDAAIVRAEFEQVVRILRLAASAGEKALGVNPAADLSSEVADVKRSQEQVWLLRNRPGGLADSLAKMNVS